MSFWGDPPKTTILQGKGTGPTRPPGFKFAEWLFGQLPGLANTPFPTYQGNLDPGLSPTMQDTIRRAQGYAQSSPPEILAGAQGSLGRFMSPTFMNPWNRLFGGGTFGGAPDYFGVNPQQRVYGGGPAGQMAYQGQQSGGQAPSYPGPSGPIWAGPQAGGGTPNVPVPTPPMPGQGGAVGFGRPRNSYNQAEIDELAKMGQRHAMHATDYASALQRIHGRPVSDQESNAAWMSGNTGILDQARTLFRQDVGGDDPNWTPAQKRYSDLVTQHGISRGSQLFNQEQGP